MDKCGFSLEEPQSNKGPTPELAMGWQRLLDFQSPAKDLKESEIEMGRSNV